MEKEKLDLKYLNKLFNSICEIRLQNIIFYNCKITRIYYTNVINIEFKDAKGLLNHVLLVDIIDILIEPDNSLPSIDIAFPIDNKHHYTI
jgi:hypothetical protein